MTRHVDEGQEEKAQLPLRLEITPPEGDVIGILAGQGTQEPGQYQSVLWTPPAGTTREHIGTGSLATFWRITLPGGKQVLEVHVPTLGLSVLYDDGDIQDTMIS